MSSEQTVKTGEISWFDFPTQNEEKAKVFYKTVLGWNFIPMGPEYWMIEVAGKTIGGLRKEANLSPANASRFVIYFSVPSLTEAKSLVTKAGGQLVGESHAINGGEDGHFQHFLDLDSNAVALWSMKA